MEDDGKTYTPFGHQEYERQLIEKKILAHAEPILESFTEVFLNLYQVFTKWHIHFYYIQRFLRRRRSIFDFSMAIHAGLCLSTLLVLPTQPYSEKPIIPRADCTVYPFSDAEILNYGTYPLPELKCEVYPSSGIDYTPPSGSNDGGDLFAFLMYYSGKALLLNVIFQIISSLVLIGSWERLVYVMESKGLTGGDRFIQRAFAWTVVVGNGISFFLATDSVLTHRCHRLYDS
jgi:hypothetical protein